MGIQASDNIYPLYTRETPEEWSVIHGITKREQFAAMAMQGLIAHYGYGESPVADAQELAQWSVSLADALIHQLED